MWNMLCKIYLVTILKSKILLESAKIKIVIFAKCIHCDLSLQQLQDVAGLNNFTIFVVIVLMHIGRSCRPTVFGFSFSTLILLVGSFDL